MRYAIVFLLLCACQKKPLPTPNHTYPVKAVSVEEKSVPIYIESLGHVEAITSIQIKSRIEGELVGIHFIQGQEVKKNDLLFTIDPRPYEAALKEAEASLQQNLAKLDLAAEKVKRYRLLTQEEFYSQIDYESLQADFSSAKALVAQAQAQVENAKINLDYCSIYAPIDGKMGLLQTDFGNLVANNGSTLASLNQMSPIYVTFAIPEFQLHRVQKKPHGLKVLASYENFAEESFEGKLFMIDNAVNEDTGMIALRAIFENGSQELWPGQFVRIRLILQVMEKAVIIPYTAVQMTQQGPIVYLISEDNTVEPKSVRLGQREDENVIVLEGLNAGQKIVLEGQLNLYKGAKVSVRK